MSIDVDENSIRSLGGVPVFRRPLISINPWLFVNSVKSAVDVPVIF